MEIRKAQRPESLSIPLIVIVLPIGACFIQAAIWFSIYKRALGYTLEPEGVLGVLFLVATFWLILGLSICVMLASELSKRGAFFRAAIQPDSMALAGELNLFLGFIVFVVSLTRGLYEAGFYIELLLLGAFIAIGSLIFGLASIKSKSFSGDMAEMAVDIAIINGLLAFLGTFYMAIMLYPPHG